MALARLDVDEAEQVNDKVVLVVVVAVPQHACHVGETTQNVDTRVHVALGRIGQDADSALKLKPWLKVLEEGDVTLGVDSYRAQTLVGDGGPHEGGATWREGLTGDPRQSGG